MHVDKFIPIILPLIMPNMIGTVSTDKPCSTGTTKDRSKFQSDILTNLNADNGNQIHANNQNVKSDSRDFRSKTLICVHDR